MRSWLRRGSRQAEQQQAPQIWRLRQLPRASSLVALQLQLARGTPRRLPQGRHQLQGQPRRRPAGMAMRPRLGRGVRGMTC